jgi:hypothetical protein
MKVIDDKIRLVVKDHQKSILVNQRCKDVVELSEKRKIPKLTGEVRN